MDAKLCKRCGALPALRNEKYCKDCRKQVLSELQEAGYLQNTGWTHVGQTRTQEQRENTYETKHGTGY